MTEFKIQNIVSTIDCKFPIRVDKLAQVHAQFCTYDPDFFPALVYRMVRPSTVLLVFVSGKVIITGGFEYRSVLFSHHTNAFPFSFPLLPPPPLQPPRVAPRPKIRSNTWAQCFMHFANNLRLIFSFH